MIENDKNSIKGSVSPIYILSENRAKAENSAKVYTPPRPLLLK